jgi:hypothetical protein
VGSPEFPLSWAVAANAKAITMAQTDVTHFAFMADTSSKFLEKLGG